MGNRAVIAFENKPEATGIYLHWNGGVASILAFVEVANKLKLSAQDESYTLARLVQIIGNFFGGTNSLGVGSLNTLDCDNGDNGLYILGPNKDGKLAIVDRCCAFFDDYPPMSYNDLDEGERQYYQKVLEGVTAANKGIYEDL